MTNKSSVDTRVSPPHIDIPRDYNAAHDLLRRNLDAGRADKLAYIDDAGRYTYGELAERVGRCAAALSSLGLHIEQRVMLCLQDSIDFPVAFLGCIQAGLIPVAVNTLLTTADYAYMLHDSRAFALVVTEALLPAFAPLLAAAPFLKHVIVSGREAHGHHRLEDLLRGFQSGGGGAGRGGVRFRMDGPDIEASMALGFVEAVKGGEKRIAIARPKADGGRLEEEITIRIPPGVTDGGRLRIPGKGGEGRNGGEPGDLWVQVRVSPHPVFERSGRDLELELPITLAEAVCGGRVEIPTLDGRATLTIPPGTSSGSRLRLRGQGVPGSKTAPAGDLFARIKIVVPKDAAAKLESALREVAQEDPRKGLFS